MLYVEIKMTVADAMNLIKVEFPKIFGEQINDIRLEEVDDFGSENFFHITVSYLIPDPGQGLATVLSGTRRLYKKVIPDKKENKIKSIQIYKNA